MIGVETAALRLTAIGGLPFAEVKVARRIAPENGARFSSNTALAGCWRGFPAWMKSPFLLNIMNLTEAGVVVLTAIILHAPVLADRAPSMGKPKTTSV